MRAVLLTGGLCLLLGGCGNGGTAPGPDAGGAADGATIHDGAGDAPVGDGPRADGASQDGPRIDGARADGARPPDGGKTPDRGTTKDSGKTPDSRPNTDAGSLVPLPGCTKGCRADEVCVKGTCERAGPTWACGSGTYGDGLPASGVLYVDGAFKGTSTGSAAQPFTKIAQAIAALPSVAGEQLIAVAGGTYDEALTFEKNGAGQPLRKVRLRCRCASMVSLTKPLTVKHPGTASELNVVVEGCRLSPQAGTGAVTSWATCDASDGPKGASVFGGGNDTFFTLKDSLVAGWCTGVYFSASQSTGSALCLARTRLHANVRGVDVQEAPAGTSTPLPDCVDGSTTFQESVAARLAHLDQNKDFGLFTRDGAQGVAVRQSLVERSGALGTARGQGFGIYLGNSSSARFSANVVRSNENRGLAMRNQGAAVTSLVIEANAFSANAGAGIALQQLAASQTVKISGNVVEATRALAGQPSGDGIQVSLSGGGAYSVQIDNNTVSSSARSGIFLEGVGGTIQTNTISSNTKYGVLLQQSPAVLGTNSFAANGQNSLTTSSLIEAFGALPTPIP